jgi:hypothetical protein
MRANTVATLAIALSAFALPAFAQDESRLDDLDADRLNSRQVLIDFDYDGGACEEVGEVTLGDVKDGTLDVTLKLVATSEVCTMQIVDHDIKEAIEAGRDVTRVAVTLLAADGQVIGTDTTEVDDD